MTKHFTVAITVRSNPIGIQGNQVYTIEDVDKGGVITQDDNLNWRDFKIVNKTRKEVSAVVYRMMGSQFRPFHITNPTPPNGEQVISIRPVFALWTSRNAESGTMSLRNRDGYSSYEMPPGYMTLKYEGGKFVTDNDGSN